VPTLSAFKDRFLDGYARANRQKPSGIAAKETILNVHLVPQLGTKWLDTIMSEDVQRLKHHLRDRAPKTVNNVLTVLNMLLKKAVEWDAIDRMPCTIRLLPIPKPSAGFYDFDEYDRLVEAAKSADPNAHMIVLLGGDAGLRCGEMMALEWRDVDLGKRQLCVQRSEWKARHGSQRRATAVRADDGSPRDGAARASALTSGARALSAGWVIVQRGRREAPCGTGRPTRSAHLERRTSAAAYVLLASRDAWGARQGDSGARRPSGSDHDAAVHASESRGDRRRDPAARFTQTGRRAWRHVGDGKCG
jgi:integrase